MPRGSKQTGWLLLGAALLFFTGKKLLAFNVKPGAVLPSTPEMQVVEQVVAGVWARWGRVATVTSGTDSHYSGGFHPVGLALDFRTNDIDNSQEKHAMISEVRRLLSDAVYDIIFEDEGYPNEHLHIEYDPH